MHDNTAMTEPLYRVGLIGCGRKGTVHARSYDLDPRAAIVAGADTDRENLDLFCERFGVPGYDSYEKMIEQEGIDIALPILPVSPNPEIVIRCAQLGVKGIGCEKPMAASLARADEMVDSAEPIRSCWPSEIWTSTCPITPAPASSSIRVLSERYGPSTS